MTITDLTSRQKLTSRVFKKRVRGIDGTVAITAKEIWRPLPGETLLLVAAWVICMKHRGSSADQNAFALKVGSTDVVTAVDVPSTPGITQRLAMVSQTVFTNTSPLLLTSSDTGTGDELTQDLVLIAIKI